MIGCAGFAISLVQTVRCAFYSTIFTINNGYIYYQQRKKVEPFSMSLSSRVRVSTPCEVNIKVL